MKITQAFILAGGKGIRLRPLTYKIPKGLIKIRGKPILQHVIENLSSFGIKEVILSLGYKAAMIKNYFKAKKLGLKIRYVTEKKPMGTAGALSLAKEMLNEDFVMMNGDILINTNMFDFYNFYFKKEKQGGIGIIMLKRVADPSRFGVAVLEKDKIVKFIEKPKNLKDSYINTGVYILNKKILKYISGKPQSIEKEVFPLIAKEGKLFGFKAKIKYWKDIGTKGSLMELRGD